MRFSFKEAGVILFLAFVFLPSMSAHGQDYRYEFTPGISVSAMYDDNFYLRPTDKRDDYITGISPSLTLSVLSEASNIQARYTPTFVFYSGDRLNDTNNRDDFTRHSATLSWAQDLTQYIQLNLTDTYYKTEEPIEYDENVLSVRNSRLPYWRNNASASLQYLFGPRNTVTLGYMHSYLKNDDPTINDGRIQTPSASLAYWFNTKNSVVLTYQYVKSDFWQEEGVARSDYDGTSGGISYNYSFNPQTSVFIGYSLIPRDFDGPLTEDYDVQEGTVGVDHAFSPQTSILLSGGYFVQDLDISESQDGFLYDVSLSRNFERGRFTIGGRGGWDEPYLEAQRRGFTRYYSATASMEYQLHESIRLNVDASYRLNKEGGEFLGEAMGPDQEWDFWRGNVGVTWNFLQYYSLSLSYRFAKRDDNDVPLNDYTSNRVMLSFGASRLFRW
jgi:predicted porin